MGNEKTTPLIEAIKKNDIEEVRRLIEAGADVNAKDNFGNTSLVYAIRSTSFKSIDTIELLISHGADVNSRDNKGQTPLMWARTKKIAQLLIDNGADVNIADKNGETVLNKIIDLQDFYIQNGAKFSTTFADYIRRKDIETVRKMIEDGADVNAGDIQDGTPLIYAASVNSKEIAELLIEKGADVNRVSEYGDWEDYIYLSPLMVAAQNNAKEVAQLLIEKGAEIDNEEYQYSPLIYAVDNNAKDVVALLLEHNVDRYFIDRDEKNAFDYAEEKGFKDILNMLHSPYIVAIKNNNIGEILRLIETGLDINKFDEAGNTPLMYAAKYNAKDVAELLIKKGADINAVTSNGRWSVLRISDMNNSNDVSELLRQLGADGFTPLMQAATNNDKELAEQLINNGADVSASDREGITCLMYAIRAHSKKVAELLIEKGADINAINKFGHTHLIYASIKNEKTLALRLIEKGSDVNLSDNRGRTPLIHAVENNAIDTAELLVAKNADVNIVNNEGESALSIATKKEYKEIIGLLIKNSAK